MLVGYIDYANTKFEGRLVVGWVLFEAAKKDLVRFF